MSLVVHKYGGTSVGSIEKIRKVAQRVIERKKEGNDMVVVLSAMSGETDRLIRLAQEVTETPNPRELDVLISTGEQVTIALFSMAVQSLGFKATSLLGFQATIHTDQSYGRARINEVDTRRIMEEIRRDKIVAVAGFQGLDERGNITTLGRGGVGHHRRSHRRRPEGRGLRNIHRCGRRIYHRSPGLLQSPKTEKNIL